jgi:hypothetical protein
MMLNPGGFSPGLLVLLVAAIGILVGLAWLHRISTMNDDPDRSSFRMHRRGTGDSRFLEPVEIPTLNWLLTRGAILFGAGTVAITLFGPLVLRGWSPLWDAGPIAIVAWLAAIAAATVGTAWMIRIAARGPEDGAPPWRSRR